MNEAPRITSVGPPPERHAERIADEMILWLHGRQQEIWVKAKGSLRTSQMGNPVGQTRAVARMRERLGDLVLALKLKTGKRGKFELQMITWTIWDPARKDRPKFGAPLPPQASLGVLYAAADRSLDWRGSIPVIVTRHALVRMAERAGMRTVEDLYVALISLWSGFCDLLFLGLDVDNGEVLNRVFDPPPQGWRVPFGDGFAVAVMSRDGEIDDHRMVVKTILPPDCEALLPNYEAA
jgi:hypothetical protein